MKKTYLVQIIIDTAIVLLGSINYLIPSIIDLNFNVIFYMMISIYAVLELCEYIFDHTRREPLYIFLASATAAFSGFFLQNYPANYVLSITIITWVLMIAIIKMMTLEEIYEKKTHLFLIKLTSFSINILIGILVSVNIYYKISTLSYMLGFLYMSYGVLELICDFLTYLSEDSKFLKE